MCPSRSRCWARSHEPTFAQYHRRPGLDATVEPPRPYAVSLGQTVPIEVGPRIALLQQRPVRESMALPYQGVARIGSILGEHLRHGPALAAAVLGLQRHCGADLRQLLERLPRLLSVGSLHHLRGIDAGQSHGDPPLVLIQHPDRVTITAQQHGALDRLRSEAPAAQSARIASPIAIPCPAGQQILGPYSGEGSRNTTRIASSSSSSPHSREDLKTLSVLGGVVGADHAGWMVRNELSRPRWVAISAG